MIYLCLSIVVMVSIDLRLSLMILAFAPLPALIEAHAAKEQTQREHALLQRWTRIFARFNEVLSGIVVVKSFVMEEREKRRFLGGVQEANRLALRGVGTDANVNAAKNAVMAVARLGPLALGGTPPAARWLDTTASVCLHGSLNVQPTEHASSIHECGAQPIVSMLRTAGVVYRHAHFDPASVCTRHNG